MSSEHVKRRLAAILAADVADSCCLIGIDEEGTLAQLKALRRTLFDPKIAEHHGRVVKNTGDGALVEFASVVDAVRCPDEIQRSIAEQNTDVPQDKRIEFRIGIHVGDVVIEENDIFGDGVNIAVRLEGIAEPGGVSISDDAHRQIRGKIGFDYDDMGPQVLKNIAEVTFKSIGPKVHPGRSINQLADDADFSRRLAHTAFKHVADAEFAPDLLDIDGLAFVGKGGVSRDDEQRFGPRQPGNDVLDHAVGEIFLLRIAAHVLERQHRDRGLVR